MYTCTYNETHRYLQTFLINLKMFKKHVANNVDRVNVEGIQKKQNQERRYLTVRSVSLELAAS